MGFGLDRHTTAAVGVLKAIHCETQPEVNRITKDTICFNPSDFNQLSVMLALDLHEPPMSQCPMWIDDSKLNHLALKLSRLSLIKISTDTFDTGVYIAA